MRKKSGMSISMPRIDSPLHHEILAREVDVSFGKGFVKFWDCGRFQIKYTIDHFRFVCFEKATPPFPDSL